MKHEKGVQNASKWFMRINGDPIANAHECLTRHALISIKKYKFEWNIVCHLFHKNTFFFFFGIANIIATEVCSIRWYNCVFFQQKNKN